jgi:hypothetical protein
VLGAQNSHKVIVATSIVEGFLEQVRRLIHFSCPASVRALRLATGD